MKKLISAILVLSMVLSLSACSAVPAAGQAPAEESYKLLSSKFEEKLINVVELMKGRDAVLQARQNELQSKYLAILNINMLNFYRNGQLK